jgi:beta-lactamase superfamily II metal-dependent hydrolase
MIRIKILILILISLLLTFCPPPVEVFSVQFIAGVGGTISGNAVQIINKGENCTVVTALPNSGYRFDRWTGDHIGTENPLSINNVKASMTITAKFIEDGLTISGLINERNAPISSVTMTFSDGISAVLTDSAGKYSQMVPNNWSGTVTPSKPGYIFTPEQRTYSNVITSLTDQDFIGTTSSDKPYLKVHYINVQQGQSIFIEGPNGTSVLLDGGDTGKGTSIVVPYLKKLGYSNKINNIIISHRDTDHYKGISEILSAGYTYDHIYDNGSTKSYSDTRLSGISITPMETGFEIDLGYDAKIKCVTSDGRVIGYGLVSGAQNNENDRSLGILIQYGNFNYISTGDLGGGNESCTGHSTSQVDVETSLVNSIMPGGVYPLLSKYGVELMHVAHHGSESSTNSRFMNSMTPKVACISVGAGQSSNWYHPRKDVVEKVLLSSATCVTAPAALVLQTEEGAPIGLETSKAGYCVGNIIITTDGESLYQIEADGKVYQGPNEQSNAGLPRTFKFDEN